MSDGEKKPTYKRLCILAEKTATKYNERGYGARVYKFPHTKRVIIMIDEGDTSG